MTRIASIHYLLGSKKESLKEICRENPDWNYEKLFSKTGIDRISVGAITHSFKSFDSSLLIL